MLTEDRRLRPTFDRTGLLQAGIDGRHVSPKRSSEPNGRSRRREAMAARGIASARVFALALCVIGCSAEAPLMHSRSEAVTGALQSQGGELGTFEFTPDRCLRATDSSDEVRDLYAWGLPSVQVRGAWDGAPAGRRLFVVNRAGSRGATEVTLDAAHCSTFGGYGDRDGFGVRVDCRSEDGGHVWGYVAASGCR